MDPRQNKQFDSRGLLMAMAISMVVLFVWEYFRAPMLKDATTVEQQVNGADASQSRPSAPEMVATTSGNIASNITANAAVSVERIQLENDVLSGSVALTGGRIDELELKGFYTELGGSEHVTLFAPEGEQTHFFDAGWQATSVAVPSGDTVWKKASTAETLTPETPLVLQWENTTDGFIFQRTFTMKADEYMIAVDDKIIGNGGSTTAFGHYAQLHKVHEKQGGATMYNPEQSSFYNFLGPEAIIDGIKYENDFDDIKDEKSIKESGKDGWIGIKSRYFTAALIPDQMNEQSFQFKHSYVGGNNFYSTIMQPATAVNASDSDQVSVSYRLYAGPNVRSEMAKEEVGLEESVDYGWYHGIAVVLFGVIEFFHGYVGNYGYAIILTTAVLKLILFPLSAKSFRSMARMKKLTPKMEKLKERHGDDREAMAMAMMKLYKEEKVNPMSGCWPVLIQIPIFFAFYKVILVSFEFRHAPFMGWIDNLSAQDPYFVLPVLMGLTMVIQQRLNPPPSDPVQQMVMKWLPVVFTVMFLFFPAGLVLYWVTNNVLSVSQQYYITKKIEADDS